MTELDEAIEAVAAALAAGSPAAIPTDTVYGLAVDPRLEGATGRLFALKGRPETVALPLLLADPADAQDLAAITPQAAQLMQRFWPGPLTLVLPRTKGADLQLGGDSSTIGLRCPSHECARMLLRRTGPLAVSSANRHGKPPLTTAASVRGHFGAALAVVLDGGTCDGVPSTVVSLVGPRPSILRTGPVPRAEIEAALADALPGAQTAERPDSG